MKSITVRNLILGQGLPKICIPIMGVDYAELLDAARFALDQGADLYEWRADSFEVVDEGKILEGLKKLRGLIEESPLIFTLRSEEEGGKRTLSDAAYESLNGAVIQAGMADIIDVELSRGAEMVNKLISASHDKGMHVILSSHNFKRTPPKEDILSILQRMQELNGDISKIAVMANSEVDVLLLLDASLAMKEEYGDRPFVTVAMGEMGMLSRIAGGIFGSALTYTRGVEPSAPGQLTSSQVRDMIQLLQQ